MFSFPKQMTIEHTCTALPSICTNIYDNRKVYPHIHSPMREYGEYW